MAAEGFLDAALVLVGHGSTVNDSAAAPICQHAAELRQRGLFADVRECFWKQDPRVGAVLASVALPRVFIVPVLAGEGYFSEEAIPRELGLRPEGAADFARVQQRGAQVLHYCAPVGSHPRITALLLDRAREVVERHPFPRAPGPADTSLFLVGHGTPLNAGARRAAERQAGLIRARGEYAQVEAVFLEEEPRVADCHRLARARNLVVVPFFISEGPHAAEDIPVLLGEPEATVRARLRAGQPPWRNPSEKHGKLVWYAASIGSDPVIADVILERVRELA